MPVEDGHSFAERLRADQRLAPIPVIFLSGFAGPGEQAKAFEKGADDFLAKPCSPSDLVTRVRSHLRRRQWQRRIDEGLARIQDVERARDELLSVLVHEVGGLVTAIEAELKQGDVARANQYLRSLGEIVEGVRARFGWRHLPAVGQAAEAS
jgi:DNA-binding response OmpR family regulator